MGHIRRFALSAAFLAAAVFSAGAQTWYEGGDAETLLKEDITRCANLHHNYEAPAKITDTPAPRGYRPFYVSHYGRHGSRYHWTDRYITSPLSVMDSLHVHGLLTSKGEELRGDLEALLAVHSGQVGYLTHKGASQHQEIAHRLCGRCPELFRQKDRNEVWCTATSVQRCIQSMANFCIQLARENPDLKMNLDAGERFTKYLSNSEGVPKRSRRASEVMDSVLVAGLDPSRLMAAWFTDADRAMAFMKNGNVRRFIHDIFWAGSIVQCLDVEVPDINRHFTFDEIHALWAYNDVCYYDDMCGTVENGRSKDLVGIRILRDILEKADSAVAGGHRAADLRFGHDTGLSPLLSLLRLEGYESEHRIATAPEGTWYGFQGMPMASNLQMIFYRDRKGNVLVKLLRNENETRIPALKTYSGPYYRWDDLREYMIGLCK